MCGKYRGGIVPEDGQIVHVSMKAMLVNHFTRAQARYRLFQVEEASQLFGAGGVAHLSEGFSFDLADAFTGHVELLADFFQRVVGVHVDAKTHAQHLGLAWR